MWTDKNRAKRRNLVRFRGHKLKTTADGFLATFDGPSRGVRCACAIGECEMIGNVLQVIPQEAANPNGMF